MFKKRFFLLLIVSIALSACGTLEVSLDRTPTPAVDANQVATIVAATLAAIPSATPAPISTEISMSTPTVSPRGEWLVWSPYIKKEQAEYAFKLTFDTSQWEIKNDAQQNVYELKRFKQYLLNQRIPECAIIQITGHGLSFEYSVEDGQKNINGIAYETKSVKLNERLVYVIYSTTFNLGNSYGNIFVIGGSADCLASGETVLSTFKAISAAEVTPAP